MPQWPVGKIGTKLLPPAVRPGRTYEHDWVMIFSVRDNKIVRFRHYYDTGDLVGSFRGE
jgi:ketosteroid isomerase-like protein